jgi:hypothetical protein
MTEKIASSPYRVDAVSPQSATTVTGRSTPFREFEDILAEAVRNRVQVTRATRTQVRPPDQGTPQMLHDAVAILLRPLPWFMVGMVPRVKEPRRTAPGRPVEGETEE